eukprot:8426964-Heterocapsa_arctica.AAC.1
MEFLHTLDADILAQQPDNKSVRVHAYEALTMFLGRLWSWSHRHEHHLSPLTQLGKLRSLVWS